MHKHSANKIVDKIKKKMGIVSPTAVIAEHGEATNDLLLEYLSQLADEKRRAQNLSIEIPGDALLQMTQLEKQDYIEQMEKLGYQVEILYGWDEPRIIILQYLNPENES